MLPQRTGASLEAKKASFANMLRFLFPRLTPAEPREAALFRLVVAEARKPDWYAELGVPDTIDGRFAVLATVAALVSLRLEQGGPRAQAATERFVETMDAEHRQLGLGDPTLGKVVRKLVNALGRRIDLWRSTVAADSDWTSAAAESIDSLDKRSGVARIRELWSRLQKVADADLVAGRTL